MKKNSVCSNVFIIGDDVSGNIPLQFIAIANTKSHSYRETCKELYTYLRQSFPQQFSDSYSFADLQQDLSEGNIVGYPQAEVILL